MFGSMKRFGNLSVPNWVATGEGAVTYEITSLKGSDKVPNASLLVPPKGSEGKSKYALNRLDLPPVILGFRGVTQ